MPVPLVIRPGRACQGLALSALLLGASLSCQALTIQATFGSGFDSAAQATIESTIAGYESLFSNPVSIAIDFQNMSGGLGQSTTSYYSLSYRSFVTALKGSAVSAAAFSGLTSLPARNDPVVAGGSIMLTRANAQAVGVSVAPPSSGYDSTVGINLALTNFGRTNIDPGKYDLQGVVSHEIDEVLGTASMLGSTFQSSYNAPIDLYRYSAPGVRSYSTSSSVNSYFSIDNGSTALVYYNQLPPGDYGDWLSSGPHTLRVQDAYGTPGSFADLGVEITALEAVGYNLSSVPEPAVWALMLTGVAGFGWRTRRRC